ncbi:hypothetical protein ACOME3_000599 [Neoechinorhynchus agilis]
MNSERLHKAIMDRIDAAFRECADEIIDQFTNSVNRQISEIRAVVSDTIKSYYEKGFSKELDDLLGWNRTLIRRRRMRKCSNQVLSTQQHTSRSCPPSNGLELSEPLVTTTTRLSPSSSHSMSMEPPLNNENCVNTEFNDQMEVMVKENILNALHRAVRVDTKADSKQKDIKTETNAHVSEKCDIPSKLPITPTVIRTTANVRTRPNRRKNVKASNSPKTLKQITEHDLYDSDSRTTQSDEQFRTMQTKNIKKDELPMERKRRTLNEVRSVSETRRYIDDDNNNNNDRRRTVGSLQRPTRKASLDVKNYKEPSLSKKLRRPQ